MFLNARYEDPEIGQFISVDPAVGRTGEPYGYGNNNPVEFSDPTGLTSLSNWGSALVDSIKHPFDTWGNGAKQLPGLRNVPKIVGDKQGHSLNAHFWAAAGERYERFDDPLWTNYLKAGLAQDKYVQEVEELRQRALEKPGEVFSNQTGLELDYPDDHHQGLFGDYLLNGVQVRATARSSQNSDGSFAVLVTTFVLDRFDPQKGGAEEQLSNFATEALWADYYDISIGFSTTTNVPATAARSSRGD